MKPGDDPGLIPNKQNISATITFLVCIFKAVLLQCGMAPLERHRGSKK